MIFCRCKCGAKLKIYENDYMPGCRESEEVFCPRCGELVTKVHTSGIPDAVECEEE